jgi:hypothetical protein
MKLVHLSRYGIERSVRGQSPIGQAAHLYTLRAPVYATLK